jgi:outer membrane receptor protein involved in Fe transport
VRSQRPAILAACLVPILAFAQAPDAPPPQPQPDAKKIEKIEVTAPDEVGERRESTAAKIVINRDEIQKYGDTTVLDVMKRLPGVTVRGNSIMMRGLGSYTQILVNGEPVPPGFSLETLSPDLIERVEIYRSATAEFSTQAVAGTINIVLRKPIAHSQSEAKAGTSVENGAVSWNATGQLSDKAGALAYTLPVNANRFRFRRTETDEQRVANASGRLTQHYVTDQSSRGEGENVGFTPRLAWTPGKDNTLNLDGFINANHFHGVFAERSTPFVGAPPQYASNTNDFHSHFVASRVNATWIRKLADNARLEAKAGLNYNHRSSHVNFDAFDGNDVFILHRTVDSTAADSGATTQGKYVLPFVASHAFNVGWDGAFSMRRENRLQHDESPVGLPPFDIDESYDARVYRIAGYAQDEWEITPRLSTYLGLRWEGIETRSTGNTVADVKNRSGVWGPIVQVLWKLPGTEKDQLRGGIARTYKAPSTFQIIPRRFIANNNTPTTPDFQGNPDLKPELAWGLDGAYEHYFAAGGVASVSAFARRIDDVIQRDLFNVDGTYITRPVNRGSATVRGIEMDMKTSLKTFFAAAPAVDIRANYSRYWSHVDALPPPDNRLDSQTPYSGNVGFDWKLAAVPLTIGGNFNIVGNGTVRNSLTQQTYSTVRRTLELYGLWKFDAKTQLRATLGNLLAQENDSVSRYFDGITAVELTAISPTYRRVAALLEMKF